MGRPRKNPISQPSGLPAEESGEVVVPVANGEPEISTTEDMGSYDGSVPIEPYELRSIKQEIGAPPVEIVAGTVRQREVRLTPGVANIGDGLFVLTSKPFRLPVPIGDVKTISINPATCQVRQIEAKYGTYNIPEE